MPTSVPILSVPTRCKRDARGMIPALPAKMLVSLGSVALAGCLLGRLPLIITLEVTRARDIRGWGEPVAPWRRASQAGRAGPRARVCSAP